MRILLAEDERSLSRAVTALLERNHYAVDAVYDGAEALDYLEGGNYDALTLDIMMPKMDGMEVLRRLRQQGNSIPVLMLTARGEVEDKVLGLDSGANDYLTKPFATEELLARLRAITRQSVQLSSQLTSNHLFGAVPPLTLVHPGWQLPAGQQRVSDDGAVPAQSPADHPRGAVSGANLGL